MTNATRGVPATDAADRRSLESSFRADPSVRLMETGDGALLLHLDSGDYFSLNETGLLIWRELSGDGSVQSAVDVLAAAFPASDPGDRLRSGVESFLDELLDRSLLRKEVSSRKESDSVP